MPFTNEWATVVIAVVMLGCITTIASIALFLNPDSDVTINVAIAAIVSISAALFGYKLGSDVANSKANSTNQTSLGSVVSKSNTP